MKSISSRSGKLTVPAHIRAEMEEAAGARFPTTAAEALELMESPDYQNVTAAGIPLRRMVTAFFQLEADGAQAVIGGGTSARLPFAEDPQE